MNDGVLDWGWLAGWIDAAGEIAPGPRVTMVFPTREALDLVRRRYGGSARKIRHLGRDGYRLIVEGKRAEIMLDDLKPFLVVKEIGR